MTQAVATRSWASPESVFVDLDELQLLPRCPRTRRTIVDKFDETERHSRRIRKASSVKWLHTHRGIELTEAQNRALFADNADPDDFKGFKLNTRQRAQVKLLKKARRAT